MEVSGTRVEIINASAEKLFVVRIYSLFLADLKMTKAVGQTYIKIPLENKLWPHIVTNLLLCGTRCSPLTVVIEHIDKKEPAPPSLFPVFLSLQNYHIK